MLGPRFLLCSLSFLVLAAPAPAAVVGGSLDDPLGDTTAGPGTDVVRAAWLFDPEAGRWTVSVTFATKPTDADYGIVNATIRDATAAGCGGEAFAVLRGSGRGGGAAASVGTAADGVQPDGSTGATSADGTNVKSDEGRTTTLHVAHPRLVGRTAACVHFTISNHGVKDSSTVLAPGVPVTPEPARPAPGQPDDPYTIPGPGPRVNLRLASSRTLRFRQGAARLTLAGASSGLSGKLTLVAGKRRIAQGRFTATAPVAVKAKLLLTRAGATYIRRRRSGNATLIVRSTLRGRAIEQRFRVRFRR